LGQGQPPITHVVAATGKTAVAKKATCGVYFALAASEPCTHISSAFQASSPKTFQGAGSRWPHFFACRVGGLRPFGHGICDTLPSAGVSCCAARVICAEGGSPIMPAH
jgi:hypothetical protein